MKDLSTLLQFKVASSNDKPRCGSILVAEPFLKESYFRHGVISIIDYLSSEGATGVVMNNPADYTLSELLDGLTVDYDIPVYCGGPLGRDRLFFVHTLGENIIPGAREFAPGLYLGGDFDTIINYINSGYAIDGYVRFFVGYSCWAAGQLERELSSHNWVEAPAPDDPMELLCDNSDRYWHKCVRSLGDAYRSWSIIPRIPELN